jgi:hypothetical protein
VIEERPEQLDNLANQVQQGSPEPPGYVAPVALLEHKVLKERRETLALRVNEVLQERKAQLARQERKERRAFLDQQERQALRAHRHHPPLRLVRQGRH